MVRPIRMLQQTQDVSGAGHPDPFAKMSAWIARICG